MTDDPSAADLSDEQLIDRYRRSKGPNGGAEDAGAALEAELRRRRLLPDREDTIPEDPPGEVPGASGPIGTIEPGPVSDADNGGVRTA